MRAGVTCSARTRGLLAITASVSIYERAALLAEAFTDAPLKPTYPALVVKAVHGWFTAADDE